MERLRRTTYPWAGWFGIALGIAMGWWLILTLMHGFWDAVAPSAFCTVVPLTLGVLFLRRSRRERPPREGFP
jgi:apolipoprotein N-acyltransferase